MFIEYVDADGPRTMAVRAVGISGYGIAYPRPWLPAPGSVREVVPAIGAVAWSVRVLSSSSTSGTALAERIKDRVSILAARGLR